MADRPIIFSAPMVRALLEGRKTQTRRVISTKGHANLFDGSWSDGYVLDPGNASWRAHHIKYATGDRLWVRENCATWTGVLRDVIYRSDDEQEYLLAIADAKHGAKWKGRPSIHMPRWASRLTLTVTSVRVQRLQDISEEDAVAEGVIPSSEANELRWQHYAPHGVAFRDLWNSLHGPDAWDANPWVVALTFTVERRNIDEVPK